MDSLGIIGKVIVEIHDAKTGVLKSRDLLDNLAVDLGKEAIAALLTGDESTPRQVTYSAVGTGTTTPTSGDTALQTEIARKQVSVRSRNSKVATFKTYYGQAEANGVLREIGLFGGFASNTPNSGTLFARLNMSRTKTSSDTLSITHSLVIT